MFTEKIYREYFLEIYRKEKQVLDSLCCMFEQISNDRMRKKLIWHIKQETRHVVLIEELVKLLSTAGFPAGEEIGIKFEETEKMYSESTADFLAGT